MEGNRAPANEHYYWPAAASFLFCVLLLACLTGRAVWLCGGHFGYPMDDSYIHMAMAKHFALQGVWGVTAHAFSSSTSSPFYTLVLSACYRLTGVFEPTPLVLNVLAAAGLLIWANQVFLWRGIKPALRFAFLALLVFATPLPILAMGGMEHVLHTLLTLIFVHICCKMLGGSASARLRGALLILTPFLVMTRYEGCFLVAVAGILFLLRKQWPMTVALAIASILPLAVYGWISYKHGWYPLPNSLLLKMNLPSKTPAGMYPGFLAGLARSWSRGIHVVLLIAAALLLLTHIHRQKRTMWSYSGVGLILFASTATLHLIFARTGWFFRYEAYLVALGILVIAVALREIGLPARRMGAYILAAAFGIAVTVRTGIAFYHAPQAVRDIYEQQYQMGLFVERYLNSSTVLLNDIGAVSFLSDANVLDAIGLGDMAPARARRDGVYSFAWLDDWAKQQGAVLAIMYPHLADPNWYQADVWTIPGNYMSGSDSVGFYVLDAAKRSSIIAALDQFRPRLPARVIARQISR